MSSSFTRKQALEEADAMLQALIASGDEEIFAAASGPDGRLDLPRLMAAVVATRERMADKLMQEHALWSTP